jgi:hypothetical protein
MNAVIKPVNGEMVLTLSDEILDALGVKLGDTIEVDVDDNGMLRLETLDGQRQVRLQRGRDFMQRYKETLDILAK